MSSLFAVNEKKQKLEREKKVVFVEEPKEPKDHNSKEEHNLTKSSSVGGLNSLSKNLNKQQETIDELTTVIDSFKQIISKYEHEIKELQKDNKQRDNLIKQYEDKYKEIEKAINDIWNN
jgi:predicted RNase H-like nuclease (RuvC/YqgF family)